MAEPDPLTPAPGGDGTAPVGPTAEGEQADATARRLLLSLLDAHRIPGSARRARVEAGVVRVLIAEGAADTVAGFLAPFPGRAASFEVAVEESGPADGGRRSLHRFGDDVELAVREALRAASRGAAVLVTSVGGGIRRAVLQDSEDRPGALEFVAPTREAFQGDEGLCQQALAGWKELAQRAASDLPAPDLPASGPAGAGYVATAGLAPERRVLGVPAGSLATARSGPPDQDGKPDAAVTSALLDALSSLDLTPDADAIRAAVHDALATVSIELDLSAVEAAVRAGLAELTVAFDPAVLADPVRRAVATMLGLDAEAPFAEPPGPAREVARRGDLTRLAQRSDLEHLARRQDVDGIGELVRRAAAETPSKRALAALAAELTAGLGEVGARLGRMSAGLGEVQGGVRIVATGLEGVGSGVGRANSALDTVQAAVEDLSGGLGGVREQLDVMIAHLEALAAKPGDVPPAPAAGLLVEDVRTAVEQGLQPLSQRLVTTADLDVLHERLVAPGGPGAAAAALERIEDKLDELLVRSPPAGPGGQLGARPVTDAARDLGDLREQLEVLVRTVDDRIRAGGRSIEALADELADRDRTGAALVGEVIRSTDAALERLARRIEGRLDALADGTPATGTPGSHTPGARTPPRATPDLDPPGLDPPSLDPPVLDEDAARTLRRPGRRDRGGDRGGGRARRS